MRNKTQKFPWHSRAPAPKSAFRGSVAVTVDLCHGILCSLKLNPSPGPAGSQSIERRGERGGGKREEMERSEQIHHSLLTFGFLRLPLLTPQVWSAQPLRHLLERKEQEKREEDGEMGRTRVRVKDWELKTMFWLMSLVFLWFWNRGLPYLTPTEHEQDVSVLRLKPDISVHTGSHPSLVLDPSLRTWLVTERTSHAVWPVLPQCQSTV